MKSVLESRKVISGLNLLTVGSITVTLALALLTAYNSLYGLLCLAALGAGIGLLAFLWKPLTALAIVPPLLAVGYRIELGFFSFAVGEIAAVVVVFVAALRVWAGQGIRKQVRWDIALIGAIGIFALPSVLLESDIRHVLSVYRDLIIPCLFYLGFVLIGLRQESVIRLVKWYLIVAALTAALGILQARSGGYLLFEPIDPSWVAYKLGFIKASGLDRWLGVRDMLAHGLCPHANRFASYLIIPACVAFALGLSPANRRGEKWMWRGVFVIILVGMVYTFARSSLLATMFGLFFVWFRMKRRIGRYAIVLTVTLFAVSLLAVFASGLIGWDQLGTLRGRGVMVLAAWELIKDHPFAIALGGSTEEYLRFYYQASLVHNILLYSTLEYGLLATAALIAFFVLALKRSLAVVNSVNGQSRYLAAGLFAGLVSEVLIYAQTAPHIDSVQSNLCLFFWIGVVTYLFLDAVRAAKDVVARETCPD